MPLKMDEGWNQIQLNLADLTRRAYGTNYAETLRVQIHANCRVRRIYFADRLYSEEELPPEFKLYLPVQVWISQFSYYLLLFFLSLCLLTKDALFSYCRKHDKFIPNASAIVVVCRRSTVNYFR